MIRPNYKSKAQKPKSSSSSRPLLQPSDRRLDPEEFMGEEGGGDDGDRCASVGDRVEGDGGPRQVNARVWDLTSKIRPIDKKLQYQMQKLTTAGTVSSDNAVLKEDAANASQKSEDLLKYRPNPDMLASKLDSGSDMSDVTMFMFAFC
ncbi:hypothetical protein MLD38_024553 [Melastoma candidum]|uniref:Uncharacterized protein n=1 Tax=Melastoma candidum TaxID=119954 RepID=A0ACB9NZF2_9MYRT|nr:hypothetical protein MLD38_024553 [Melastoma candidum]